MREDWRSDETPAQMAGEEYDRLFPDEKPADSGWIRFSDRAPTEEDCLLVGECKQLAVWLSKEIEPCDCPMHVAFEYAERALGRPDCFWRPIPPRPEMKP